MTGPRGPQRRVTDHVHPEYWTEEDHHRFEARVGREQNLYRQNVSKQLDEIKEELRMVGQRITYLLGAIGLLAFLLPIIAPFLRSLFGLEVPSDALP